MGRDLYGYAWQQVNNSLTSLAGSGSFDDRLRGAAWGLSQFPVERVPAEVHKLAVIAQRAFMMYPGEHPRGAAAGLIPMLPESRKVELSTKVVRLFEEVARLSGASEAGATTPSNAKELTLRADDEWEFLYWGTSTRSPQDEQETYIRYAQHYLPNFPGEVLLEWLGRHGYEQMRRWSHLDLKALRFERVEWAHKQVGKLKAMPGSECYLAVGDATMGAAALARSGDWLAQRVLEDGTWPFPVVVLENKVKAGKAPIGHVLVEGHRRVSLLLNTPQEKLKDTHQIWLARAAS